MQDYEFARPDRFQFQSRIEAITFFGMILLLVWAPLPFASNRPWGVSILVVWVSLLAALWACAWLTGAVRAGPALRKAWLPIAFLAAWLLTIALQVVPLPLPLLHVLSHGAAEAYGASYTGIAHSVGYLSVEPAATRRYLGLCFALVAFFVLLLLVVRDESRLRIVCYTLVFSGAFQAVLGVYLYFTGARYNLFFEQVMHGLHLYPSGTFINRNHFAAYLEISLSVGAGLMVAQFRPMSMRTWKQRLRWIADLMLSSKARLRILLVIMVIALILTRSRMANGAFFAAIFAGGAVGLMMSKVQRNALVVFLVSMIVLDVFVIGSWIGVDKVMERMRQTSIVASDSGNGTAHPDSLGGDSFQERAGPGLGALAALRDYPAFGTGGGTFYVTYPRYRAEGSTGFFDHAHMDYAEFASEGGVIGITFLLGFALTTFATALKVLKERSNPLYRGVAFGAFMGMVAIGLHATVEFVLQIPAVAFAFVTLCAGPWIGQKGRSRAPMQEPAPDGGPVEWRGMRLDAAPTRNVARRR